MKIYDFTWLQPDLCMYHERDNDAKTVTIIDAKDIHYTRNFDTIDEMNEYCLQLRVYYMQYHQNCEEGRIE